jgi:hypothetical protein
MVLHTVPNVSCRAPAAPRVYTEVSANPLMYCRISLCAFGEGTPPLALTRSRELLLMPADITSAFGAGGASTLARLARTKARKRSRSVLSAASRACRAGLGICHPGPRIEFDLGNESPTTDSALRGAARLTVRAPRAVVIFAPSRAPATNPPVAPAKTPVPRLNHPSPSLISPDVAALPTALPAETAPSTSATLPRTELNVATVAAVIPKAAVTGAVIPAVNTVAATPATSPTHQGICPSGSR